MALFAFEAGDKARYSIRAMTEADLPSIMAIETRAHSHPWRQEHFENCLKAGYLALVVEREQEGGVLAYALASAGAGQADILNIVVAPEAQRRGLARALLEYLIGLLTGLADSVFLEVRASNYGAIALYEELGFNQVGRRRDYYPTDNGREDALLLALALSLPGEG